MKKYIILLGTLFLFSSLMAQNEISTKTKIGFIENKGQIHDQNFQSNPEVLYLLNLNNGLNVQLKANSFSYDTYTFEKTKKDVSKNELLSELENDLMRDEYDIEYKFHRVDIEFVNANKNPQIIAEHPSQDFANYYNAVTPESGATDIRTYGKITYKDVYPGIDVVFVADENAKSAFEYNFVVHPNADASQIKLKYNGAFETLLENEQIKITTSNGAFYENIPASWIDETKQSVQVNYFACEENTFGFQIPEYSKSKTLVIDPVPHLLWATYYGGTSNDYLIGIITDADENIIACGFTNSTDNIATSGSQQSTYNASDDAFIVKFNSVGTRLWATYYGGNQSDSFIFCKTDNENNIFVVGTTKSTSGIVTNGAHQTTYGGGNSEDGDGMLVKFNTMGQRQWATYYGGTSADVIEELYIDNNNNIIVGGYTSSENAIATDGAHQTSKIGYWAGFIAKFNPEGNRQWATYYGGEYSDLIKSVICDNNNNIYFAGKTKSSNDVATEGSHQSTKGGDYDGFLVKFNSSGVRQWGTYYGGTALDVINSIAIDASNNIVVCGMTLSTNALSTEGAHQTFISGDKDGFIAKFNSEGVRLWGTYFGGEEADELFSVSIHSTQHIFVGGISYSTSNIATAGAFQTENGGSRDGILARFNASGQLQWATYYGGSVLVYIGAIANIGANRIIIAGYTWPGIIPISTGAHQTSTGGGIDGFIASFCIPPNPLNQIGGESSVCKGTYQTYSTFPSGFSSSYEWTLPMGVIGTSTTAAIEVFISEFAVGGDITVYGTNDCTNSEVVSLSITVNEIPGTPVISQTANVLTSTPAQTYQWYKDDVEIVGATNQFYVVTENGEYYVVITENGCYSEPSNIIDVVLVNAENLQSDYGGISFFPNPANDIISIISNQQKDISVDIYNIQGKKVFHNLFQKSNYATIDVSNLSKGVYFIKLVAGIETVTKKLIIH
jgi:predicted SpoU family rRNA methylase